MVFIWVLSGSFNFSINNSNIPFFSSMYILGSYIRS